MSATTTTTFVEHASHSLQQTVDKNNKSSDADQLLARAAEEYTKPLWTQMTRLNPPLPNPRCIPHVWEYARIRPCLVKAGELVTEKQAERRVLMLINPARDAPYTTDTIYAGLQCVMPGETAPAHRHTAFACRFIIQGSGGFTAVHGSRVRMQRGDVILTPTWNWHDHGKDGDDTGPMIWLDTLDLPNFVHFPVHFVEHFAQPRYPADDVDSSSSAIVFPWQPMKADLNNVAGAWASLPYLKADGREVSRILGVSALRLSAGKSSNTFQETASSVYHVIEGSGHAVVNGSTLRWKAGDTFTIPAWQEYQIHADESQTLYLYRAHDTPMLQSLGFYRNAADGVESLVSD